MGHGSQSLFESTKKDHLWLTVENHLTLAQSSLLALPNHRPLTIVLVPATDYKRGPKPQSSLLIDHQTSGPHLETPSLLISEPLHPLLWTSNPVLFIIKLINTEPISPWVEEVKIELLLITNGSNILIVDPLKTLYQSLLGPRLLLLLDFEFLFSSEKLLFFKLHLFWV